MNPKSKDDGALDANEINIAPRFGTRKSTDRDRLVWVPNHEIGDRRTPGACPDIHL